MDERAGGGPARHAARGGSGQEGSQPTGGRLDSPDRITDPSPDDQGGRRAPWSTLWGHHPAVRSEGELTVGERAADYVRNGMGSWLFVFGAVAFLGLWITLNIVVARSGHHAFDAFPFILLNLVLSCLAAMQGAILLIAAKRTDQVASELAAHDYAVNRRTEALLQENNELTKAIKVLAEAIQLQLDPDTDAERQSRSQS
jgi:uncharacterized membrane protein